MKKKIALFLVFVLTLSCSTSFASPASVKSKNDQPIKDLLSYAEEYAEEYNVSIEELANLSVNLDKAIDKFTNESFRMKPDEQIAFSTAISENLTLAITGGIDKCAVTRSSVEWHVWTSFDVFNNSNKRILTLTHNGWFVVNGTTSNPIDHYGEYRTHIFGYGVTTDAGGKSQQQFNAWTRTTFNCTAYVGNPLITGNVTSYTKTGRVYCDANGNYSATWN